MACSSITNYHIIDKVVRGDRPRFPSPEECGGTANRLPSKLWNVITTCWHPNAADRLSMPEVMYELPVILEEARIQSCKQLSTKHYSILTFLKLTMALIHEVVQE
jgi:hypothetical protein